MRSTLVAIVIFLGLFSLMVYMLGDHVMTPARANAFPVVISEESTQNKNPLSPPALADSVMLSGILSQILPLTVQAIATTTVHSIPLTATSQVLRVAEDSILQGVWEADDLNGEQLHYGIQTQPINGIVVAVDPLIGHFTYKGNSNFNGTDHFTYIVTDTSGLTATGLITVLITPVNDPPVANDDTSFAFSGKQGVTYVLDVLENDTVSPDTGEELRISSVGTPNYGGIVSISSDRKRLHYRPQAGMTGKEHFTYTIDDGNGGTAAATVTITSSLPLWDIHVPIVLR